MLAIVVLLVAVLSFVVVMFSRSSTTKEAQQDTEQTKPRPGLTKTPSSAGNPPPSSRGLATAASFKKKKHEGRVALNVASIGGLDIPVFDKTDEERKFIEESLRGNFIFSKISDLNDLVSAFEKHVVPDGEIVITENDDADYFYVIESGIIDFFINQKEVGARGEGEYFGDLALLRNCKRAATCISSGECVLWRLGQLTYRAVVARNRTGDLTAIVEMLKKIPLFTSLNDQLLSKIATAMEERKYEKDAILMKKGDIGSEMHIIKSGKILLKDIEAKGRKYDDVELKAGDFFGERAVLESEPRAATAVATEDSTMYCISKESFVKHIGSMDQLKRDATYLRLLVSSSKGNKHLLNESNLFHLFTFFIIFSHPSLYPSVAAVVHVCLSIFYWIQKSIPFFANSDISPSEYEEIISRIQNVSVEKGAVIYEETDRNNKLYLIESGEVTLSKGPGDAQNDVLRTEKMHFGESHFIHDEVLATETVTAKVDTAMGVLSVESLASVIRTIDRLDETLKKNGSLRKGKSESKQVQSSETGLSDLHRHRILGMGAFGKGKTFIFLLVVLLFCATLINSSNCRIRTQFGL